MKREKSFGNCRFWAGNSQEMLVFDKARCNGPIPVGMWAICIRGKTRAAEGAECGAFRKRIVRQPKAAQASLPL